MVELALVVRVEHHVRDEARHLVAHGVDARDELHVHLRVQARARAGRAAARLVHALEDLVRGRVGLGLGLGLGLSLSLGLGIGIGLDALEDLLHHGERRLVARDGHGDDGRHLAQQRVHVVLGGQRAWLGLGLGLGLG